MRDQILVWLALMALNKLDQVLALSMCMTDEVTDGFAGGGVAAGDLSTANFTLIECLSSCRKLEYTFGAVESGRWCFCYSPAKHALLSASGGCSEVCLAGKQCGGDTGQITVAGTDFSIVLTSTVSGPLLLGANHQAVWTAQAETNKLGATFLFDAGNGAAIIELNGSINSDKTVFSQEITFWAPGEYQVRIAAKISPTERSAWRIWTVKVELAMNVMALTCPDVVEYEADFTCTVETNGGQGQLTYLFDNVSGSQLISSPSIEWWTVGSAPPFGTPLGGVYTSGGASNFVLRQSVVTKSRLRAVWWLGGDAQSCTLQVIKPQCVVATSSFCPMSGTCSSSCPTTSGTSFVCPSNNPVLSTITHTCSRYGVFTASSDSVVDYNIAVLSLNLPIEKGKIRSHVYSSDFPLLDAGSTIKVNCIGGSIAYTVASAGKGDILDETKNHLIKIVAQPVNTFSLENSCSKSISVLLRIETSPTMHITTSNIKCEKKMDRLLLVPFQNDVILRPTDTPAPDSGYFGMFSINLNSSIMINSMITNDGGPFNLTYDFHNSLISSSTEFINRIAKANETFNRTVVSATSGLINVRVYARNQLSTSESSIKLQAQWPIVESWELTGPRLIAITGQQGFANLTLQLRMPAQERLPTDAQLSIVFGSDPAISDSLHNHGLTDLSPITAATGGYFTVPLVYQRHHPGSLPIEITMTNLVSRRTMRLETKVIEEILGLNISLFQESDPDPMQHENSNKDMNHIFYRNEDIHISLTLQQGTIEYLSLYNTSAEGPSPNNLLLNYTFTNPLMPQLEQPILRLNDEGQMNITIKIVNDYKTWHMSKFINMVERNTEITVAFIQEIDDFISDSGEEKKFRINYDGNMLSRTCLVVDFGDGSPLAAYGSQTICQSNFSHAIYIGQELTQPMNISHTYWKRGDFTLLITLHVEESSISAMKSFTVTNFPCTPPSIELVGISSFPAKPTEYFKSQSFVVSTDIHVNCTEEIRVIKEWKISEMDQESGELIRPIILNSRLDSWDKSELRVIDNFLSIGLYQLYFNIVIDNNSNRFKGSVLRSGAFGYVQIIKSPLMAGFLLGGSSEIYRGWGQLLTLDGSSYSCDSDDMTNRNFSFSWYCHRGNDLFINESFFENGSPQTIIERAMGNNSIGNDLGGCFGEGPVRLNYTGSLLNISTSLFQPHRTDISFIISMKIEKDNRSARTYTSLRMVEGSPPTTVLECSDPLLCSSSNGFIIINTQNNIAIKAYCIQSCSDDILYTWRILHLEGDVRTPFPNWQTYIQPSGISSEVQLLRTIFSDFPDVINFNVEVSAVSSITSSVGKTMLTFQVNRPPHIPTNSCICTPERVLAVIDTVSVSCPHATDLDGDHIAKYVFFVELTDDITSETKEHIVTIEYVPRTELRLGIGQPNIYIQSEDMRGGYAKVMGCSLPNTIMPNKTQLDEFISSHTFLAAVSVGDAKTTTQIFTALETVRKRAEWLQTKEKTPEEIRIIEMRIAEENAAALKSLNNLAINSKDSANLVVSTVETILSQTIGNPLQLDLESAHAATNALYEIGQLIERLDFTAADEMLSTLKSTGNVAGMVYANLAKIVDDQNCTSFSQIDINQAADFFYENVLDYDYETIIPDRITQFKCNTRDQSVLLTETASQKLNDLFDNMTVATLRKMIVGQNISISTPSGVEMFMTVSSNISGSSFTLGGSVVQLPTEVNLNNNEPVAVALTEFPTNTNPTAANSNQLSANSKVVSIQLYSRTLFPIDVSDLPQPVVLTLPRSTSDKPIKFPPMINFAEKVKDSLIPVAYTEFISEKPNSGFVITLFTVNIDGNSSLLLLDYNRMPTLDQCLFQAVLGSAKNVILNPTENTTVDVKYEFFIDSKLIANRTGRWYVGIAELNRSSTNYNKVLTNIKSNTALTTGIQINGLLVERPAGSYAIQSAESSCLYYDKDNNRWRGEGLEVIAIDSTYTKCSCSHLTSFSSGFFIQPNNIDFTYVFANTTFEENITIYMTIITSLSLMLFLMIWARWQDKKDIEKLGVIPLPDNDLKQKYLYEIMIFTGHKSNAATDSQVYFMITGETNSTKVRTFGKPNHKFFKKSGKDAFVMSCPHSLGPLEYIKIWHDNTGSGRLASWFLLYIQIQDLQTREKYIFVCNRWMGVEFGDGELTCILPLSGKEQMEHFSHLFPHKSQESLSDGHLWFSIFLRPLRSRFSRCQRVMCCFVLLFLSMMVNALWYGTVPSKPNSGSLQFGPFSVSLEQMSVGFMSNIIVFFPSMLIVLMFRKSRPKNLRESRINRALNLTPKMCEKGIDCKASKEDKTQNKMKLTIPWWCRIIAWLICFVCLAGSVFIIWAYGIQFGNEKTTKWITALMISFFSSIMLTQPIKVLVTAMVLSFIFKNIDLDSDDANEDELPPQLDNDETWPAEDDNMSKKEASYHPPIDEALRESLRKKRIKETQMWSVLREILSYSMFLWILMVLSYDNRDPNSYYLQLNLRNAFIKEGEFTNFEKTLDFRYVKSTEGFWKWARAVIMPELRAQTWYNGKTPAYGLRGFLDDRVNRIMGYAIIKQVRVTENTCTVHNAFSGGFDGCHGFTSIVNEDKSDYCVKWTKMSRSPHCNRNEYRYTTASKLNSLPFVGQTDIYSGGGYVFKLTGRQKKILTQMNQLEAENWIDSLTRAVFIEFTVYNAQVNLFGVATIYVEMSPGGGFHPNWRFDALRLTRHQDRTKGFMIFCEIMYILFILYFFVREIKLIIKLKKAYFKQYSVIAEWAIIILSITASVFYILRYIETNRLLTIFKKTYGNAFIRFQYAQTLDDIFGYLVGLIVFISTVKFIKLLRFNKRIGMLSSTLKHTWNDLAGFLLIFLITLVSFSMMFSLLLVTSNEGFKDIISAVESCFSMMLGKFNFMAMYQGSLVAAIMFFVFGVYMNLVFVNVLLTIIINSFEKVKRDISHQSNDCEMVDFILQRLKAFVGLAGGTVAPHSPQKQNHGKNNASRQLVDKFNRLYTKTNHSLFGGSLKKVN